MGERYNHASPDPLPSEWSMPNDITPQANRIRNLVCMINKRLQDRGIRPKLIVAERQKGYVYDPYRKD